MRGFVNLRNKKGLTLVEMTISALILGLVLGAMLGTFVIARVSATKAKHRIEVLNLLRAKMEAVKDSDYYDIGNELPEEVSIDIGPDLLRGTGDDLVGSRTVDVVDNSGYKNVTTTLSWNERAWGGATRSVSANLVTLVCEYLHTTEE